MFFHGDLASDNVARVLVVCEFSIFCISNVFLLFFKFFGPNLCEIVAKTVLAAAKAVLAAAKTVLAATTGSESP